MGETYMDAAPVLFHVKQYGSRFKRNSYYNVEEAVFRGGLRVAV